MQKKALLALLMAVIMMITCSCALIEKDETVDRATEIVKVGDTVHTKGEVNDAVNYQLSYMAYMYSMFGMNYDPTDAQNIADARESVINSMIRNDVLNMQVAAQNITLDADEEAAAKAEADSEWQYYRDSIQSSEFAETELTGDELNAALDARLVEMGYNYDNFVENYKTDALQEKLKTITVADVTVTDEELQAELDTRVESAKASYESNLSAYGSAVNGGSTVYYRPAGYRLVKQILVKFTEADQTVLDGLKADLNNANTAVSTLKGQLTDIEDLDAALADHSVVADITEEQASLLDQLAEANAKVAALNVDIEAATKAALANIDATADEVLAKIAEGEDWAALTAEYNQDPGMNAGTATAETGYAVCENMANMDEAFVTAAMGLAKVGDVSGKVPGMYGYYIVRYEGDVQEGPVALDEVRDTIESSVLTAKQDETYEAKVAEWVAAVNAKPNMAELDK